MTTVNWSATRQTPRQIKNPAKENCRVERRNTSLVAGAGFEPATFGL
jgi:hypothetical protein